MGLRTREGRFGLGLGLLGLALAIVVPAGAVLGVTIPHSLVVVSFVVGILFFLAGFGLAMHAALWPRAGTWIAAKIPIEVRWKTRVPKAQPVAAPRGLWDFRRDGDRALAAAFQVLQQMTAEMGRSNKRVVRHGKRMDDAVQKKVSVESAYKLATRAAADINRHAAAMERLESRYRTATETMTKNYSDWISGQPSTDLSGWADELRSMSEGSAAARGGIQGYRQSTQVLRDQNISQPLNQACDHLVSVLDKIVATIQSTETFARQSTQRVTERATP